MTSILIWLRKPIGMAIAALLVLALLWWGYSALTGRLRSEAKLANNQAQAAASSGSDAVNVVGSAAATEASSADLTQANDKEIRNAQGADAAVAAPVRDAGFDSLCRRSAYRLDPKCVQRAHP